MCGRFAMPIPVSKIAAATIKPIHHRMPVIIPKDHHSIWLDSTVPAARLLPLLKPFPDNDLEIYEVSNLVNSPKNDFSHIPFASGLSRQ